MIYAKSRDTIRNSFYRNYDNIYIVIYDNNIYLILILLVFF